MQEILRWVWQAFRVAGWAPLLVFVVHLVISRGFGAYLSMPELDIPMHFVGGVAIAFFLWRSVSIDAAEPVLGNLTRVGRIIVTLASVGSATAIWEFAEWASDRLGFTQAQLGLGDTMLDMSLGVLGGVVAVTLLAWIARDRSP